MASDAFLEVSRMLRDHRSLSGDFRARVMEKVDTACEHARHVGHRDVVARMDILCNLVRELATEQKVPDEWYMSMVEEQEQFIARANENEMKKEVVA